MVKTHISPKGINRGGLPQNHVAGDCDDMAGEHGGWRNWKTLTTLSRLGYDVMKTGHHCKTTNPVLHGRCRRLPSIAGSNPAPPASVRLFRLSI